MQAHEDNPILTLREHLLNSQSVHQTQQPVEPLHSAPSSSHDHHIDPAIAGSAYAASLQHDSGVEDQSSDIRKGRRELSTSKRAAQNRAAQRAFRQRKEAYIGSLQEKVKEYEGLISNYKAVQQENFQLREYIIQLQSRLLEAHGELPPTPAHIDLSRQPAPPPPQPAQDSSPSDSTPNSAVPASSTMPSTDPAADELRLAAAAAAAAHAVEGSQHSSPRDTTGSNAGGAAGGGNSNGNYDPIMVGVGSESATATTMMATTASSSSSSPSITAPPSPLQSYQQFRAVWTERRRERDFEDFLRAVDALPAA